MRLQTQVKGSLRLMPTPPEADLSTSSSFLSDSPATLSAGSAAAENGWMGNHFSFSLLCGVKELVEQLK